MGRGRWRGGVAREERGMGMGRGRVRGGGGGRGVSEEMMRKGREREELERGRRK